MKSRRLWVISILVMTIAVILIPNTASAQYTPTTSIGQLYYPNQVTSGNLATVTFVVSYSMGGYSTLAVNLWDRGAKTFEAANSSASPKGCIPNENSGCFVRTIPYSVGVEFFVFHMHLMSGTYKLEVRTTITDDFLRAINSTASRKDFSIIVSPTTTTAQSQGVVSQATVSEPYQAISQEETLSSSPTVVASGERMDFVGLIWVALLLSIVGIGASFLLLHRLTRLERVEQQDTDPTLTEGHTQRFSQTKATMFCRQCGVRIPRDSKFCQECGYKLA